MAITVKTYLTLRQVMDNQPSFQVEFSSISIRELMAELSTKFGSGFNDMVFETDSKIIGPHVRILVNGKHYGTLPQGLETILKSGDEIGLFPPIAGG